MGLTIFCVQQLLDLNGGRHAEIGIVALCVLRNFSLDILNYAERTSGTLIDFSEVISSFRMLCLTTLFVLYQVYKVIFFRRGSELLMKLQYTIQQYRCTHNTYRQTPIVFQLLGNSKLAPVLILHGTSQGVVCSPYNPIMTQFLFLISRCWSKY